MTERRLAGYLLLPRPGDLVKAWIFPACFLLGVLAEEGASGREVLRAALVWAALELLLYQARYQWNDIRGFEADQRHPERAARGRLPGPPSRGRAHIRASAAVAAARLGLAAALALALPGLDLGRPPPWPFPALPSASPCWCWRSRSLPSRPSTSRCERAALARATASRRRSA